MPRQIVFTTKAAKPPATYSQAVKAAGLVFVSGAAPIDPATGGIAGTTIQEQTSQCLKNIAAILEAAGSDMSRVLKMTVYVSDMDLWDAVNKTYARVMGDHRPARAIIPTGDLHNGMLIEIDAVAAVG